LAGRLGAAYVAYNHGKKNGSSWITSLRKDRPRTELAAGADIFLHNWESGQGEELGLVLSIYRAPIQDSFTAMPPDGEEWRTRPALLLEISLCKPTRIVDGLNPVGEAPFHHA